MKVAIDPFIHDEIHWHLLRGDTGGHKIELWMFCMVYVNYPPGCLWSDCVGRSAMKDLN